MFMQRGTRKLLAPQNKHIFAIEVSTACFSLQAHKPTLKRSLRLQPSELSACTLAPLTSSSLATSTWPHGAATWRAVQPHVHRTYLVASGCVKHNRSQKGFKKGRNKKEDRTRELESVANACQGQNATSYAAPANHKRQVIP